jgi:opacity protein-like surface antigen
MKNSILFSVLFLAGVAGFNTANAQTGLYLGAQVAPQGTVMFNKDDVDDDNMDIKAKTGVTFGIGGGYKFNKNMGVGLDLMYSMERQRYENHNVGYTQRLDYLKLPVYFTYNTNPSHKVMFTAKAGPQLGIKLDSKVTDADWSETKVDNDDKYEDFTFGAMAGVGARMAVAKNLYVEAGVRFDGTFTNTENEDYKSYTSGREKTYNFNAGFETGIKYFFN